MRQSRRPIVRSSRLLLALAGSLGVAAMAAAGAGPAASRQGVPPAERTLAALSRGFRTPPEDARILMRWWWFGPTVARDRLARELRTMKEGGIGGVEIQPVYPVTLDDEAAGLVTHPFLSEGFLDHLRFAARTARELGLRVDLTLGSGWPFGGPTVPIAQAAGKLRVERIAVPEGRTRVAVPGIGPGERLLAAFLAPAAPPLSLAAVREVSDVHDGVLRVPASPRPRDALFFVASRTGMMVKRPAVGAEGFVLDHYDRGALDAYLHRVGERLLSAFDGVPPEAVFCDSLEVYGSDWTGTFLEAFREKRGYDLRHLLPALVFDAGPESAALRHDWGRTLTDLVKEQFVTPLQGWAAAHGTRLRLQGYGLPPATISTSGGVDLPEGEGFEWKTLRASRWAASIGHLYDRPVVSSETWTWLHSPAFRATPLDLKAEADLHFLQGVNQLVGHGWPYTADGVADPGWRFYAAGAFNDRNPWWIVMPDLALYLQRVSWLMRQGRPVNDVAVYLPVPDTWAHTVPGKLTSLIEATSRRIGPDVVAALLEAGFGLDVVDDGVLLERGVARDGQLVIGQSRYRALVLPGIERIPPETMRALEAYARAGVRIVATRRLPALSPGYLATAADHEAIRAAAARLFGGASPRGTFVEREAGLGAALTAHVTPDVTMSAGGAAIGFVHRRTAEADVYFVANTSNEPRSLTATFRVRASRGERWDALTGGTTAVAVRRAGGRAGTTVDFELAPYGSTVLAFPTGEGSTPPPATPRRAVPPAHPPLDLSGGWRVTIGPGATPVTWSALASWTDHEATRHFSGVAVYERDVDVPAALLAPGTSLSLDLGPTRAVREGGPGARFQAWVEAPVREAAVVYVNGTRAGSVWCPPYAVDVTGLLAPRQNRLRIEVANLALNRMAGRALPDYTLLNRRYGTRFEPQDMDGVKPVPAGLLGPIRLIAIPAPAGPNRR